VLREIADALNHNPTWKLRVEGHTPTTLVAMTTIWTYPNAAPRAVKLALVTRYHHRG